MGGGESKNQSSWPAAKHEDILEFLSESIFLPLDVTEMSPSGFGTLVKSLNASNSKMCFKCAGVCRSDTFKERSLLFGDGHLLHSLSELPSKLKRMLPTSELLLGNILNGRFCLLTLTSGGCQSAAAAAAAVCLRQLRLTLADMFFS